MNKLWTQVGTPDNIQARLAQWQHPRVECEGKSGITPLHVSAEAVSWWLSFFGYPAHPEAHIAAPIAYELVFECGRYIRRWREKKYATVRAS